MYISLRRWYNNNCQIEFSIDIHLKGSELTLASFLNSLLFRLGDEILKIIYFITLGIAGLFLFLDLVSIFYYKTGVEKKKDKDKDNSGKNFLEIEKEEDSYDFSINIKSFSSKMLFGVLLLIAFFIPIINIAIFGFFFLILFYQRIKDFLNL